MSRTFAARLALASLLTVNATALTACRAGYVARVSAEHLRFVYRAVPIADEIRHTADAERRAKLELVLAVRDFAAQNGLDPGGSYLEVSDTGKLATAFVVTAAYRERLEAYVWTYPVVGSMPYRGYFERADADGYASKLDRDGLDTHVVAASGYSTLGWLDDPLPSGVLAFDRAGVATFVLHELTHRRLFVSGAVDFNETLASAVAARLSEKFFVERGDADALASAERRHAAWRAEAVACDALAGRLDAYFGASAGLAHDAVLAGRRRIYEEAAPQLRALGLWVGPPGGEADYLNNAVLLAWYRYRRRVGDIEGFLDDYASVDAALADLEARLDGDDDPWLAIVSVAGKHTENERARKRDPQLVRR